jgi:hypothetical protein
MLAAPEHGMAWQNQLFEVGISPIKLKQLFSV